MTGAGQGFAGLGVELASAGFFESFARNEKHFYGNSANGQCEEYYCEKKNLHFKEIIFNKKTPTNSFCSPILFEIAHF